MQRGGHQDAIDAAVPQAPQILGAAHAAAVLAAGWPHTDAGRVAIAEFDHWLRADGHRRNPGTTADLVAACLFVALREGIITLPPQVPWSAPR